MHKHKTVIYWENRNQIFDMFQNVQVTIKIAGRKMKELNSVKVTTLVDNNNWKSGLTSSWGIHYTSKYTREGNGTPF
jgi:hypothetical protein